MTMGEHPPLEDFLPPPKDVELVQVRTLTPDVYQAMTDAQREVVDDFLHVVGAPDLMGVIRVDVIETLPAGQVYH